MSRQGVSQSDLCGVGVAPEQADLMTLSVQSAIAATGSVLSQAVESYADIVFITSVHSAVNDGVMIRNGNAYRKRQVIINGTSTVMKLYPPSTSASLNNQAAGTHLNLASGLGAAIDTIGENLFWVRT